MHFLELTVPLHAPFTSESRSLYGKDEKLINVKNSLSQDFVMSTEIEEHCMQYYCCLLSLVFLALRQ